MDNERKALLDAAKQAIIQYDSEKAEEAAKKALDAGIEPYTVITEGFVPGITEVGNLFDRGTLFLPELILTANAMKAGAAVCLARVAPLERKASKKVVMGTVEGDIHDIGKSIVVCMLMANGYEVHDLGVSVSSAKFVEKAIEVKADVVGMSALLTTTMVRQKGVIEALKKSEVGNTVKTIVGGAVVSQGWANRIGADAYGENAVDAVLKIRQLTGPA
jgi:trimethylamine corrinoid protein